MRGRPILALVFVTLVALALTIPLRDTGNDRATRISRARGKATPTPVETPTPDETPTLEESPTPTESPTPEEVPDTATFSGEFPEECLEPVEPPAGDGRLAISEGRRVEVHTLDGNEIDFIYDAFPLEWSPSGEFFMTGTGKVFDRTVAHVASLLNEETTSYWAWSPIADCLLVTDGTAMSVYIPGENLETLHSGSLTRFAFSPTGGSLAYLEEDEDTGQAHLWVADLATGDARRLTTLTLEEEEQVVLAGWTPDARHVLYWQGFPEELLEQGDRLQAVSARGRVTELPTMLSHKDFLAVCDDELLGVVGAGSRLEKEPKRLAALEVGEPPDILTPEGSQDVGVSCSPTGDFAATIRTPDVEGRGPGSLTVLDSDGSEVLSTEDPDFKDAYSLWGRGGAGLLFIRQPLDGGNAVLWHIAEGGAPASTGITLTGIDHKPGTFRDSWGHWVAWSADRPSGVNSTSGP